MLKRTFDVLLSSLLLLVLLVPGLMVLLVLRMTGEGKVWYPQERVGLHGRPFRVFKLVTMREGSELVGTRDITLRNDPRVLPVGRLLRKAKINELPQLINILKGDMSFVGWRPLMPTSFGYYPEHVQREIVRLKPGLTGIGSIVFRDEESIVARSGMDPRLLYLELIAPYKGELELWYQENQSFLLDLKILVATAWVILFPGADGSLVYRWFPGVPARPDALRFTAG